MGDDFGQDSWVCAEQPTAAAGGAGASSSAGTAAAEGPVSGLQDMADDDVWLLHLIKTCKLSLCVPLLPRIAPEICCHRRDAHTTRGPPSL